MPNDNYRLTPRAREDLAGIWRYSADTWGRARAERQLESLAATFALLAEFPAMAPLRTELSPPARIHPHGRHLILYIEDEGVIIVRILHGRQDLLTALSE